MELWVRSQNKKILTKVQELSIEEFDCLWIIHKVKEKGSWTGLGTYKTKERALEVLDEIQSHLVTINDKNDNLFYVYQMPED